MLKLLARGYSSSSGVKQLKTSYDAIVIGGGKLKMKSRSTLISVGLDNIFINYFKSIFNLSDRCCILF